MRPGSHSSLPRGARILCTGCGTWIVRLGGDVDLASLRQLPGVIHVEPDRVRSATGGPDPLRSTQTYLAQIRWTPQSSPRRPLVALIDTGVDGRHPDLDGVLAPGARSFVDDAPLVDRSGHGTHLAGLIAAEARNGAGIVGVANVRLLVVKVADSQGRATTSTLVRGIRYAVSQGAKVINLSFGGEGFSRVEQNAILDARRAGVLVVAAAGNTGRQGSPRTYPGAYRHVLAVAAARPDGAAILDSTQGTPIALAAPGKRVNSTLPRGRYGTRTGTSMATAIVAGAAARLLSVRPRLDPSQVREMLVASAADVPPAGVDDATGWGVLDLTAALATAPPTPDGPEPNDDAAQARRLPPLIPGDGAGQTVVSGTVDRWADRSDDYRVRLVAGEVLDLRVDGQEGSDMDLVIWRPGAPAFVEGPAYTRSWLAATALGPGTTESLSYTATETGEYTVEVAASVNRGRYRLEARRGPAPTT